MCVYVRVWSKNSEAWFCPLTERVHMYVVGDIEVHEKLSRLNEAKYMNLDTAVNVFLLALSSPMLSCVSEAVVIYWPLTKPSIKRWICVNKRRNSRSRWVSDNYITRCHRRLGSVGVAVGVVVGDKMLDWEPSADRGLWALSDPRLSNPAKMRKKCCYGQKNLGSICSSLSLSQTHLSHTTNINPFENKVWEIYFYKEVCSVVHWSSSLLLTMFPHIFVYVYVQMYCSIQHCVWWCLRDLRMSESVREKVTVKSVK